MAISPADCDVSILILAHNKADYTQRTLNALFLSALRPFHVVLVDNGSTDHTPQVYSDFEARAAKEDIAVSRMKLDENTGVSIGRNRARGLMTGRYWVSMDNDILVRTRSWLEMLRATLQEYPKAGIVGPKLVYPLPPHDIQNAGCEVTKGGQVVYRGRGAARTDPQFNSLRECQTLISATWMMRADVAQQVGLLDEQFTPIQFEDIDYCYRIREAGFTCLYQPTVEMYHFENVTTGRTAGVNYPYYTVKNGLRFKQKWRHRFSQENGPDDKDWSWATIPTVTLDDVPKELPLL
ncbi:MAG TPA: glycosyltransferase family 2 protein [Planctomycetota bacterium]|nr:glycosyltransferase family 2 protein [Planctomycetota bacterium]